MMVCACRYLREVRNHDHLVVLSQPAQAVAHPERNGSTDAGVDLVEDQRGHPVQSGQDGLERQHDAGELST